MSKQPLIHENKPPGPFSSGKYTGKIPRAVKLNNGRIVNFTTGK